MFGFFAAKIASIKNPALLSPIFLAKVFRRLAFKTGGKMADICAPMSGNIWKIVAKEGDKVKEDDELIIMEVMKMEVPITAPCDGTIACIKVKEEDAVEADAVVIVLE